MITKIFHLGDIHIRTYRLHNEYMEVFQKLVASIKEESIGLDDSQIRIVIAGDLVHQKIIISNEQLILGTWLIRELEKIAPVIIIAGNHDLLENNKDRMDSISPMVQFLPDLNINYFKESKCYLDDNIVWCVYSIFDNNDRPDIDSAKEQFGLDKTYVGLFHGPLVGAKTDIGYTIDHGVELEQFKGLDIVLCADIHKRQEMVYDETKIVFCGSLIQQNYGENVSKHGYLSWDVETLEYREHDIENRYPLYTVRITSTEDIDNKLEKFTNL